MPRDRYSEFLADPLGGVGGGIVPGTEFIPLGPGEMF